MKSIKFVLIAFLMSSLVIAGFSQTQDSTLKKDKKTESDDRQEELRKLTDHLHRWDFNVDLDDKELEAKIEQAVDQAMKNVSLALKNLDIRIAPIEINIPDIDIKDLDIEIPDVDLDPIDVQMPDIDIHIDPIDMDNLHRHDHWNSDVDKNEVVKEDDESIQKDKDKEKDAKDKSLKNEKDKSGKGDKDKEKDKTKLKKIN